MKEKRADFSRHVRGVRLRRSDLREILGLLHSPGAGFRLTIETDGHAFDNVDELISFKEPITQIQIVRARREVYRYQSLSIRSDRAHLMIHQPEDEEIGLGTRICDLLAKRQTRFRFGADHVGPLIFGGMALSVLNGLIVSKGSSLYGALNGIILLAFAIAVAGIIIKKLRGQTIRFRPEPDEHKPINWRTAAWAVGLIVIGSVVTQIAITVKERLWPKDAQPSIPSEALKK